MNKDEKILEVFDCLCQFVIDATKKDATMEAVQALPGTVEKIIQLYQVIRIHR